MAQRLTFPWVTSHSVRVSLPLTAWSKAEGTRSVPCGFAALPPRAGTTIQPSCADLHTLWDSCSLSAPGPARVHSPTWGALVLCLLLIYRSHHHLTEGRGSWGHGLEGTAFGEVLLGTDKWVTSEDS